MAQRRWGPTLGAGVAVIEEQAARLAEPAPLGVTLYFGVTEKGQPNLVNTTLSKTQYKKKLGSYFNGFYTPDCAFDFWDHSQGAGELHVIRVTDGTEVKASATFRNRRVSPAMSPALKIEAKNGGRWGGQEAALGGEATMASDLTETTLDTGETMLLDEWKGGYLSLDAVSGKLYKVVSNTVAGIVTVESDYTMKTDYASGTDEGWALMRYNDGKAVSVLIGDGDENASDYFSLSVYVDGAFLKRYPNLSMDSTHKYYVQNIINDDTSNDEIIATVPWTGAIAPDVRPAGRYGEVETVTATVLTAKLAQFVVSSPTSANPTFALGTTTDVMKWAQTITCVFTTGTPSTFLATSDVFGDLGSGDVGTEFVPNSPYVPPFTVTDGATPLATDDTMTIDYMPFWPDALIGSVLIPDYVNYRRNTWRIIDNDHKSITVQGEDLTDVSAVDDEFMIISQVELGGGYDGSTPTTTQFINLLDVDTSPAKSLINKNKGLVKMATPGLVESSVDKAAANFAESINWQYRVEAPTSILSEVAADEYYNDTVGRNDFFVTNWPSWGYVDDPERPGQLKRIPQTGGIHGREALVAKNYNGYHKAGSGIDVTLPRIVKLDVGDDTPINEEYTNRLGINVIKKVKGNYIIWGDRTLSLDPAWKWKHQREQMSHYERQLIESMDWIIFAINDPIEQINAKTFLRSFFLPEWKKRALRGEKFEDAVTIKIDGENNDDFTRAAGDMWCDLELTLADTIERFIIRASKAGIEELVA
jgi:hypothetical protein